MSHATNYRDRFISEAIEEIREHTRHLPSILGDAEDVISETLRILPDPEAFDYTDDYAAAVRDDLDLTGYVLREHLEELFTGIVYTRDLIDFQHDHEDFCDDAIDDLGGFAEVMADATSVSEVITIAAKYGAERMWRDAMGDIVYGLETVLDRLDEEFGL